ncbi:MAG: hypothetical protein LBS55_11160 [Prevotellaceae bacterium]|jgi:hypothetical protein|nr:hypothetical protein [Prevotellaceae bacterium]
MGAHINCDTNESSFIRYQPGRGKNKTEYASVQKSIWVNGTCQSETVLWLGKVLNKQEMIFKSRDNGVFKYEPPDKITPLSKGEMEYYGLYNKQSTNPIIGAELSEIYEQSTCLSFGGVYVAHEVLSKSELNDLFMQPFSEVNGLGEAVMSLVLYKLTQGGASIYTKNWWSGTYAKFLYPNVNMDSTRISELLKEIGKEKYNRIFFHNYSEFIKRQTKKILCYY